MSAGEYIRRKVFAIVDLMRKHPVMSYVRELQDFEEHGKPHQVIKQKLDVFLDRVQRASSYYEDRKGIFDLKKYPVVRKPLLKEHIGAFLSSQQGLGELIPVTTSGSYGTPFTFFLTQQKKRRQLAEVIHYSSQAGYYVGICHGYFRTNLPKRGLKLWAQNQIFISSKVLDQHFLENTRTLLKAGQIKILIGFPTAIAFLANHCLEQRDQAQMFGIKGIITFAENLTGKQRDCIVKAFGCEVHSRYGTEELGVLGYQRDNQSGFEINNLNYIVEVLAIDADVSVKPGETGRVVVTDLHSDAFPLIRYETGDLAELGEVFDEDGTWAKSLNTLSGRQMQMLNSTSGDRLYPLFLDIFMEESEFFVQYQMIQETELKFTLKLVPIQDFKVQQFSQDVLKEQLKGWLGIDAQIEISFVNDIEMLPSGKRPYIINKVEFNKTLSF